MSKRLIFIPAFRCENQIGRVITKIKASAIEADTLIIDNLSPDHTLENAIEAAKKQDLKNVTILRNKSNYSLGGSHKIAFQYAIKNEYTHVIVLHGDDQADIADLIPFLERGDDNKYDCLLGSRFHALSTLKGYSYFRIFGNKVLNLFCSVVCGDSISDMGSGLNVYQTKFLKDERYLNFPNDLTFNVFLLFHAYLNHAKVAFFPITWREEDQLSNAKLFKQTTIIVKRVLKSLQDPLSLYNGTLMNYDSEVIYKK